MKAQMRFQKILSLVSLIVGAAAFVLAALYCSGVINQSMYYTTEYTQGKFDINADGLFDYTQRMNNVMMLMAIAMILIVAFLYITATNSRRNYYITNYIAIGLIVAYCVAFAIVGIVICAKSIGYADAIEWAKWQEIVNESTTSKATGEVIFTNPQYYSENYASMYIGIVVYILVACVAVAWVCNLVWKIKLMKGEKALLASGMVKEVA